MSAFSSTVAWARWRMGKATSSITTVVPTGRAAPTAGKSPRRTSHSRSYSAFTGVKTTGRSVGTGAIRSSSASICGASPPPPPRGSR